MDPVVTQLQEAITVTPIDIVHQRRVAAVTHDAPDWNQATANETEQGTRVTLPERNTEVCSEHAKTVTLTQPSVAPSK
jgi:hypothetical protein